MCFQAQALEKRRCRIKELLRRQEWLKNELTDAKERLMIDPSTWSFDCKYDNWSVNVSKAV